MPTPARSFRLQALQRRFIARGLLPFSLGAARTYRHFRRGWKNGVPRTFNEKLQYKLIHDRRPLVRLFSDKLAVRDYVRSATPSLRLPQLLAVFASTAEVTANVPPLPWVMKASHGSGMVRMGDPQNPPSRSEIGRLAWRWLHTDYALTYWEWHYLGLPRRILFEEHLGAGADAPADYKFYVIHQRVRLITVDEGRFSHHTRNLFYPDWTPIASAKGHAPPASVPPPRPERLDEMLQLAEQLGAETDFVRADFYVVRGEIVFGELTHAPAAGDFDFTDPQLDLELGRYWTLPADYRRITPPSRARTAGASPVQPAPTAALQP